MLKLKKGLGPDFWWFRTGDFLSGLGLYAQTIGLSWWVLELTNSAYSLTLILLPQIVTRILTIPLLAPLGDIYPRRNLMLCANICLSIMTAILAILFYLNLVTIPIIIFFTIINTCFDSLFKSGSSAVIANLVSKHQIQAAYQSTQSLRALTSILGGVLGASLVATIEIKGAVLVNALSYLASIIGILMIRQNTKAQRKDTSLTIDIWKEELVEGFKLMYHAKIIFYLALFLGCINMMVVPFIMLLPFIIKELLNFSPMYLGFAEMSIGVGTIIGALSVGRSTRSMSKYMVCVIGITIPLICLTAIGLLENYWSLIIGLLFAHLFITWINTIINSQMTLAIPDCYRSRIMTTVGLLYSLAIPVGIFLTGSVINKGNAWNVLLICCLIYGLNLIAFFLIPNAKQFFNQSPENAASWFDENYLIDLNTKKL